MNQRALYIKSYGCQMNVYDAQRMEECLIPLGFSVTEDMHSADLILFNTCHIRAKAEDKIFSDLGRARIVKNKRYEEENKHTTIVVAGCVAQALGQDIIKNAPFVDVVVGPQTYHTLPETITTILRDNSRDKSFVALGFPAMEKFDSLPHERGLKGPCAFLSIQEGCNKFCRYCVVPYTRGPEYSRPVQDVVAEARHLVEKGAQELTLLGQNVNAYHGLGVDQSPVSLGTLLHILAQKFPTVKRLRYTTSHPRDVDDSLIEAHRDIPSVMPMLHLPVQSGSDAILAQMNRQHTASFYREIIEKFLHHVPHMAFSSDFIVGYPEETDTDFQQTLDLIHDVKFIASFSFKYSIRPGTPAAVMKQVAEPVKQARLQELQAVLHTYKYAFNQRFLGETVPVLLEDYQDGRFMGRTPHMQTVYPIFDSSMSVLPSLGDVVMVHIEKALTNSLHGTCVHAPF